jgi:hypothetical protein
VFPPAPVTGSRKLPRRRESRPPQAAFSANGSAVLTTGGQRDEKPQVSLMIWPKLASLHQFLSQIGNFRAILGFEFFYQVTDMHLHGALAYVEL